MTLMETKKKRKGSNLGPHLWKLKYSIGNKEEGYGRLFIHVQTTLVREENIQTHFMLRHS